MAQISVQKPEGTVELMESFGQYLRTLREKRGVSLQEIGDNTKIAVHNLRLLEEDRYDLLPPRVFVKGFIRSYAQILDLKPEELMRRFEEFSKSGKPSFGEQEDHPLLREHPERDFSTARIIFTIVLTVAGILSLIVLILTGLSRLFLEDRSSVKRPVVTAVQRPAGYRGYPNTGAQDARGSKLGFGAAQPAKAGKKILEVTAVAPTWLRITSDSGAAQELTMTPGDVQIFTAKESFTIQTGNAGGIRLRFDGKLMHVLGKENQALSLSLP